VIVALDTETELFSPDDLIPRLVCVTWATHLGAGLLKYDEAREWAEDVLSGHDTIVGANTPYDLAQVCRQWPDLVPAVWEKLARDEVTDVLTRQKLIDIANGGYSALRKNPGYSLSAVYARLTKKTLRKDEWRKDFASLREIPTRQWPEGAIAYALDDARATLETYKAQGGQVVDEFAQTRAKWWLFLTSAWGIATDVEGVKRFEAVTKSEIAALQEELSRRLGPEAHSQPLLRAKCVGRAPYKRVVGYSRDTKAAKARMRWACEQADKPAPVTDTGEICLDAEACRDADDARLAQYSEISTLGKVLSTDIPALSVPYVHTRFEEILETGRTGSSGPNIQNIKRKGGIRECYRARPGRVFIDCDYDLAEMRTFAQICIWVTGASKLADALNAKEDPHLIMAAAMLRENYASVLATKKDPRVKLARTRAKPINFGIPGGMGPRGLQAYAKTSYGVDLTIDEAAAYIQLYLNTWPEARTYFTQVREGHRWRFNPHKGRDVTSIRHFVTSRPQGNVTYTAACNAMFQGLAAAMAKATGFLIVRECYDRTLNSPLFGCRPVNFIHDQWLVEAPASTAHLAASRVGEIIKVESLRWIPDVPATVTPALSYRWHKDTEAKYNQEGKLIPWDEP